VLEYSISFDEDTAARLERLLEALGEEAADYRYGRLAAMLDELTALFSAWTGENFSRSGALTRPWAQPGFLTALLREQGKTGYGSEQEVERARQSLRPLVDTGSLRDSFQPGHPLNVLELHADGLCYGSRDPRASGLHHGESRQLGPTYQVDRRPGHRPRYTPTGEIARRFEANARRRNADGSHNAWFYRMRAVLAKIAGGTYAVPARPILPEHEEPALVEAVAAILEAHWDNLLEALEPDSE
jgi:hypothetical protein